jgi:hypothetical protein
VVDIQYVSPISFQTEALSTIIFDDRLTPTCQELGSPLGKLSSEIVERLDDNVERLPDLFLVETELLSATSALELRMAARPGKRLAALMAAISAANNLVLAVIERP